MRLIHPRPWTGGRHRQLRQVLAQFGAEHLEHRRRRPGVPARRDRGEHPVLQDLEDVGADPRVGQSLGEPRVVDEPATVGPRLIGCDGGDLLGQHLQGGCGGPAAAFEFQ